MKKYILTYIFLFTVHCANAQSLTIVDAFQLVPNSSVLASYKNQFGAWERHGADDSFPYTLIRVRLRGNAREVISAKQTLYLNLYPQGVVESVYKDMENELLFLVPSSVQRIEMSCGADCLTQVIMDLPAKLQSNSVYIGTVHFAPALEKKETTPEKQSTPRQFFHFLLTPEHAVVKVEVNGQDQMWQTKNGDAYKVLNYGTYAYTVSAAGYQTKKGTIVVSETSRELAVVLEPSTNTTSNDIGLENSTISSTVSELVPIQESPLLSTLTDELEVIEEKKIDEQNVTTIVLETEESNSNVEIIPLPTVTTQQISKIDSRSLVGAINTESEKQIMEMAVNPVDDTAAVMISQTIKNGLEVEVFRIKGVEFEMIKVEGGTFLMGATDEQIGEAGIDEGKHQVTLSDFYMSSTEVTQYLWQVVMGSNPSMFNTDLSHPVESVNWIVCQEFLKKLNDITGKEFRLPTEAEWEYAARGGKYSKRYKYSGGNTLSDVAWYDENSDSRTMPVAGKLPNELGIYDMSGNVYEWCSDWYGGYILNPQINPTGSSTGLYRVYRGGGCYSRANSCRVSYRHNGSADHQDGGLGLRIVYSLENNDTASVSEEKSDSGDAQIEPSSDLVVQLQQVLDLQPLQEPLQDVQKQLSDEEKIIKRGPQEFTVNGITFKMIQVQGGEFTIGATKEQIDEAEDDEKPAHLVSLSTYYIGQTEVTQALWQAVMGSNPSEFTTNANCPVENVSWDDCQLFITRLNAITGEQFRLPTEAEWEYAARGGEKSMGNKYAGNNNLELVAWYDENSESTTHPVAKKKANELGVYDMSGNVGEWCHDGYEKYTSAYQSNPNGSETISNRIYRGGSWDDFAGFCRVSYRNYDASTASFNYVGLRLAL